MVFSPTFIIAYSQGIHKTKNGGCRGKWIDKRGESLYGVALKVFVLWSMLKHGF
jgi:hypothetical protein